MVKQNVFLTGWEYNRVLDADPLARRNSALPGACLWNGAGALWMFRQAVCLRESLDCERYASERLGWATGTIFSDLTEGDWGTGEPALRAIDLQDLPAHRQRDLREEHALLQREYPTDLLDLIASGSTGALDLVKTRLMRPVLREYDCLDMVSPNSLSNWIESERADVPKTDVVLDAIATATPTGTRVVLAPWEAATGPQFQRLKAYEATVQAPMIPDLLAGEGRFAGPDGYRPYIDAQANADALDVFRPIDDQMMAWWRDRKEPLKWLREEASKHLWPMLHDEWIPALEARALPVDHFLTVVQKALRHPKVAKHLDLATTIGFWTGLTATATGLGAGLMTAAGINSVDLLQADLTVVAGTAAAGVLTAAAAFSDIVKRQEDRVHDDVRQLSLFFQRAAMATGHATGP